MRRLRWRSRPSHPFNRLRLVAVIGALVLVGSFPETWDLGTEFAATARVETGRVKTMVEMHEASKHDLSKPEKRNDN